LISTSRRPKCTTASLPATPWNMISTPVRLMAYRRSEPVGCYAAPAWNYFQLREFLAQPWHTGKAHRVGVNFGTARHISDISTGCWRRTYPEYQLQVDRL